MSGGVGGSRRAITVTRPDPLPTAFGMLVPLGRDWTKGKNRVLRVGAALAPDV